MGIVNPFLTWWNRLLRPTPPPPPAGDEPLQVVSPRVLVINFDPIVDAQGTRLTQARGWYNVDRLIQDFIAEIDTVSDHLVQYQYTITNRIEVPDFAPMQTDFKYDVASYMAVMQDATKHHDPDKADYAKIIVDYDLIGRVMRNEIDEVWMFGGPYFGFRESRMVGRGAIFCNGEIVDKTDDCTRRFVIMGFNYERDVTEMVHDIGHRMETIMANVYDSLGAWSKAYGAVDGTVDPPPGPDQFLNPKNDYERFMLYDKIAPGRAEVGLVHMPPNADKNYDWFNSNTVSSACDDWLNFPDLQGTRRMINCTAWNTEEAGHLRWWFKHVPHVKGSKNRILNNWWDYTMRVDQPFSMRV